MALLAEGPSHRPHPLSVPTDHGGSYPTSRESQLRCVCVCVGGGGMQCSVVIEKRTILTVKSYTFL